MSAKKKRLRTLFLAMVFLSWELKEYNIETMIECLCISRRTYYRWKAISREKDDRTDPFDIRQSVILSLICSRDISQCISMMGMSGIRVEDLPDSIFDLIWTHDIYVENDPYEVAETVNRCLKK